MRVRRRLLYVDGRPFLILGLQLDCDSCFAPEITFEPRGDQTEVTLRHSGVPDDEMGRQHEEGWAWVLSALAERFALHPSVPTST